MMMLVIIPWALMASPAKATTSTPTPITAPTPVELPENITIEPMHIVEQCPVTSRGCKCSAAPQRGCCCSGPLLLEVPPHLNKSLHYLIIEKAGMLALGGEHLAPYADELLELDLRNLDKFSILESDSFLNLSKLMTLVLRGLPSLRSIPSKVFEAPLPGLLVLNVMNTGLKELPVIRRVKEEKTMMSIDFSGNEIQILRSNSLEVRTESLSLEYNSITEIEEKAFFKSQIAKLSLRGNISLRRLHPDAFLGIESLSVLDMSLTSISNLPVHGLEKLQHLILNETYLLKVFPATFHFQELKLAYLTYPYHCCAFSHPAVHRPAEYAEHKRAQLETALRCIQANVTEPLQEEDQDQDQNQDQGTWGETLAENEPVSSRADAATAAASSSSATWDDALLRGHGIFHEADVKLDEHHTLVAECGRLARPHEAQVQCFPKPDAFSPCEDLMGNWLLRLAVWVVSLSSLFGNIAVLVVLLTPTRRLSAPRFLMCQLAASDLAMGCYLVMLAVMDVLSMGAYFNYAINWQNGPGCQVAGFLTVLASELSVFTLTLLTAERWYTITFAIHTSRRLRLGTAMRIMAGGWVYAIIMAALPLFDVSGYYVTSICLPLRSELPRDRVYLGVLLAFTGVAFMLVCACYIRMFYAVRGGQRILQRSDSTRCAMQVAKRMTLLVFTDFACWAPIAFFGLTALMGLPLIDVPRTKILLVFFYPLNACANPYLYALLTRQFRSDVAALFSRSRFFGARPETRYRGAPNATPRPSCRIPRNSARGRAACAAAAAAEAAVQVKLADEAAGQRSHPAEDHDDHEDHTELEMAEMAPADPMARSSTSDAIQESEQQEQQLQG